ncbi:unnamed protein product, partial [Agarophyton chilense]
TTRYFLLLDDDHVFDDTTNLTVLLNAIHKEDFDIVGMRMRRILEDEVVVLQQVGNIARFRNGKLTLCLWNENLGPAGTESISRPIRVDLIHNAFVASVDVLRKNGWRNELKVPRY